MLVSIHYALAGKKILVLYIHHSLSRSIFDRIIDMGWDVMWTGTPVEDMMSLAAIAQMPSSQVHTKILTCFGVGLEPCGTHHHMCMRDADTCYVLQVKSTSSIIYLCYKMRYCILVPGVSYAVSLTVHVVRVRS